MLDYNDRNYDDFATQRQLTYLAAMREHGNMRAAGRALGVDHSVISRAMAAIENKASLRGYSPCEGVKSKTPATHFVKGTSTLLDKRKPENEQQVLQWIKTDVNRQQQFDMLVQAARDAFEDHAGIIPEISAPKTLMMDDLLALYTMGDPHIGMLAWHKETGADFDCAIARRDLCAAMDYLVTLSPPAETAIVLNLGDFFHSDSMENKTLRSGNVLDVDGRWAKVLQLGVEIMVHLIERALQKHNNVIVRNNIGNHDDHSSVMLALCLSMAFKNNPRVTVDDSTCHRWYYKHGLCLLGSAHGNYGKPLDYPQIMAVESPYWSETKYRHYYLGHVHHEKTIEGRGCLVHYMRTLANKDKYAHDAMYSSGQDMQSHIFHKRFGKISTNICDVAIARDQN